MTINIFLTCSKTAKFLTRFRCRVNEAMKTISNQSTFFYEKILSTQKAQCKTNNFQPLRSFWAQKIVAFVGSFLFCWLVCVFARSKPFRKKKKESQNKN